MRHFLQQAIRLVPWRARAGLKRIPLIAPFQRLLLAKFLEGQPFIHIVDAGPAQGLAFPVVLPEDKGVWTGTYELEFAEMLAAAVSEGDVCFDIGGWRGYFGGMMAVRGASEVVIFEPLPSNCERIERLIGLNPALPIRLVKAAVGIAPGTAAFTLSGATSMGKLAESPFQKDVSSGESVAVNVVSLDAWCADSGSPHPAVLKIDVEGAEMMVLRGAELILRQARPVVLVESHSRELTGELLAYLESLAYRVVSLDTGERPNGTSEPEVCHLLARSDVKECGHPSALVR